MESLIFHGDAFSEYYLTHLMWDEPRLKPLLGTESVQSSYRRAATIISHAQRALRAREQPRSTRTLLLKPLGELLGWALGDEETIETAEGAEDAGTPLILNGQGVFARLRALAPDAPLDLPPTSLHRRFAPTLSMVRVLEEQKLTWGLLLNAFELRLMRRAEGFVASHISFDLTAIAEGSQPGYDAWKLLWALLRDEALQADPPALERVVTLGREHQERVGEGLGQQVQEALVAFVQGMVSHPANRDRLSQPISHDDLRTIYAESLRILYRILFALYAESRNLLPMDLPTYRDGYALTRLARLATRPETDPRRRPGGPGRFLELSLRALFDLLRQGADLGPEGSLPRYGGALFDPTGTRLVESLVWGDETVAEVLEKLTLVPGETTGLVRLSYRELDVEQLGAIYENLLEQTLEIAHEPMWRIRLDDRELVVTAEERARLAGRRGEVQREELVGPPFEAEPEPHLAEDEVSEDVDEAEETESEEPVATHRKPLRVLAEVPAGAVYLKAGMGRKQSGSYYTNRAFVEFLVREATDPLAVGRSPEEILTLKVVDPAMGSGHFLVGACRRLAEHLLDAYRQRFEEIPTVQPDLPIADAFLEAGVHPEVARNWEHEDRALAACRLLIAGNCLYGVDKNPLAVYLARVSLWLATAAADHPLTFLDHRLRVGDSLLGLPLYLGEDDEPEVHLLKPDSPRDQVRRGRGRRVKGQEAELFAGVPMMNIITGTTRRLREQLNRALTHLRTISQLMDDAPGDFAGQRAAFEAMQGELRPFWSLHQLRIGRMFLPPPESPAEMDLVNRWLLEFSQLGHPSEEMHRITEPARARGEEIGAFCWQLAFPEVFLDPSGLPLANAGFDAVIGNPPWDKVKPDEREFFIEFDPTIRDLQAQERKRRIAQLQQQPKVNTAWEQYASERKAYAAVLLRDIFQHQIAEVHGRKTGGDPDLYKFFLERFYQLSRPGAQVSMLMKGEFSNVEGSTGLRRLLFEQTQLKSLFGFENFLRRFFPSVDSRQKFFALTFTKDLQGTREFDAAFMLRQEDWLTPLADKREPQQLRLSQEIIKELSPELFVIPDFRTQAEIEMVRRIYRKVPRLGERLENAWNVSFTAEFHMTNDSYLFRDAARLKELAATLHGREPSLTEAAEGAPFERTEGGEFWTTPEAVWYETQPERFAKVERLVDSRGRLHLAGEIPESRVKYQLRGYVLAHERDDRGALPVRPGETYVPLYEGRMVHQFDHCQKAYISGSGRRARWKELGWHEKVIVPHYFMPISDFLTFQGNRQLFRAGFCDITGQTNERTILATVIPDSTPCGNKIPTLETDPIDSKISLFWVGIANSFVCDWLMRLRVSNTLNFFIWNSLPFPRMKIDSKPVVDVLKLIARLCCTTPELAGLWQEMAQHFPDELLLPWTREQACLDIRERAKLRAEIDARVARLYRISMHEYARILSTFPLLDQDQPPLPGDIFIRMTNKGERKIPRSYITRDLALLTFFQLLSVEPPGDIVTFFAEAGVEIDRQTSSIRDLRERVDEATRRGAVAYVPSTGKGWSPQTPYAPPDLPEELIEDWAGNYQYWIVEDPHISGGEPTLKGTRIGVKLISDMLNKGWTFEQVIDSYPHLSHQQVAIALRWNQLL